MSDTKKIKKTKTKEEIQKDLNSAEIKANKFLNPFSPGVTYAAYLATVPKDTTVRDHLKDRVSKAKIEWLVNDLQNTKK
jgi:hypothetical protein